MLGTLPFVYLLNAPFQLTQFCFISLVGGTCAAVTGGNIKAIVLNVNVPEMRGVANGLFGLTDDLGRGFGPALIAFLELAVGGRQAAFPSDPRARVACASLGGPHTPLAPFAPSTLPAHPMRHAWQGLQLAWQHDGGVLAPALYL